MSIKAATDTLAAKGARSEANIAAGQAWQPSVLDRMILLAQSEADRIEVWQRTDSDGHHVPEAKWDAGQRAKRKLFLDLAQLVFLVQMVEADFKKTVRAKLGDRKQAAAMKEAPANATTDASGEDVPGVPGDDA